ncbi:MAG: patatin-like phospholipase family protein, partial [Pseudomonadota bacterium]
AWGVLDKLFEEDCFDFTSIVGTSAGAMNASVAAYGLASGGPEGAREKLAEFWGKISDASRMSPLQPSWMDKMQGPGNMDYSPFFMVFDMLSKFASPYQLNPMNLNPLRDVLEEVIDFDWMHSEEAVKLFICASNVMSGKIRVFTQRDLSIDSVLASACLPFMFQAAEIDGEHYWDGGYMGNPPLFPLIYEGGGSDILIVQLNPIQIEELPKTSQAILDRVNTLSFNSSLMREMRVIHFMSELIDKGFDDGGALKRIFIHTVDGEETLRDFGVSSKLNADRDFLNHLFEAGRAEGALFIERHFEQVGVASSTDIEQKFF